ncbi:two-component system response regulator [Rhizobium sp. Root1220]|nr:two-component system response regulator [Rhizobium sp. Root1220]
MQPMKSAVDDQTPLIHIVDDDPDIRESLLDLFSVVGLQAVAFASGDQFVAAADLSAPGCVVVDLRMPGKTGLDIQVYLNEVGSTLPLIFLTAHADIQASVIAMKAGAADFITKPFRNQELLTAVDVAISVDTQRRLAKAETDEVRALFDKLTPREKQVMNAICRGLLNKQAAFELGISEMTVKLHRMSLMRKMQSRNLADLVRKADVLANS